MNTKQCACGKPFVTKKPTGKFCSNECKYKFYVKAAGFTRIDKTPNPNWFKSGQLPWNTGTVGVKLPNAGSFKKGERRNIATEFKNGHIPAVPSECLRRGDDHPSWKGSEVGYGALHTWVRRHRGAPDRCEHCGASDRVLQWANKSRQYKRDLDDWLALCVPCHKAYDQCAA